MLISRSIIVAVIVIGSVCGCRSDNQEQAFFSSDVSSRNARLENLPVEEQWKIFKYGNQVRHPPATSLAPPIAKGGKAALYFILNTLHATASDLDYRDSMVIFQTMQWGGYYSVCSDAWAMKEIQLNETHIVNAEWKAVYEKMFGRLCSNGSAAGGTGSGRQLKNVVVVGVVVSNHSAVAS